VLWLTCLAFECECSPTKRFAISAMPHLLHATNATLLQSHAKNATSLRSLRHRWHLSHAISATTAISPRLHAAWDKCDIALSSPKDYHALDDVIVVTKAATLTRTIASIIEGWRRWWVVAIATPEVVVARPPTVVASFLHTAGFKTGDGGGTHIQPPHRGQRICRPPLDQALKLKGDALSCGLKYNAIA
jgi:hypothetical protein